MDPEAPEGLRQRSSEPSGATRTLFFHTSNRPILSIPDYEVLKRIGGGSYGDVWLARSILGTWRAVKVVYRNSFEHDKPFEREFKGIQRFEPISLTHECQVKILHVGRNDAAGYFYYVMELADPAESGEGQSSKFKVQSMTPKTSSAPEGSKTSLNFEPGTWDSYLPKTLKYELQRRGRLPAEECIQIGLSLTTALAHLHEHGLVHRDIKPSNIIFVNGLPKLADIGLVTDVEATRSFVGTEGFIPPEGPGTAQADLYSLGKVLYEMGMGRSRLDFPALPRNWDDLPEDEQLSLTEFNEVLVKACESDATKRYRSALQMHAELADLQRGKSIKRKHATEYRWAAARKFGLAAMLLLVAGLPLAKVLKRGMDTNPEAQRLYRLAEHHLSELTDDSVAKALDCLNQAIQIDPQFIRAYVTLFEIYCWNPGGISDQEEARRLRQIAEKLLSSDPNLGEGHAALAQAKFDEGDWQGGQEEIQKAIQFKPDYSLAHGIRGFYLTLEGRPREAHQELKEAQRLDPVSRIQATVAGFPFLVERNYAGALAQFRKAIGLEKHFPLAHMWVGVALEAKGDYLEAIAEYQQFDLDAGEDQAKVTREYRALREAYLEGRESGYWERALVLALAKEAEPNNKLFANELWELAGIHAQLGQKEKALELLEKDLAAGKLSPWLRVKPCFESLRDEPRFQALLTQMGTKK